MQVFSSQVLLAITEAHQSKLLKAFNEVDLGLPPLLLEDPGELLAIVQHRRTSAVVIAAEKLPEDVREFVLGPDYDPNAVQIFVIAPADAEKNRIDPALEAQFRAPLCLVTLGGQAYEYPNLARQVARAVRQIGRARSAELTHRATLQQNMDLEDYAHTVAHNLKAPLNGIIGIARIMQEEGGELSESESKRYLDSVVRGGRKLDRVIEEILLLATMDHQAPPRMVLDMGAIVHEALQSLEHQISTSGATISRPESWPAAAGYAPWVEEVWINYIANAINYGGNPAQIQLGATSEESGEVCFWVRDNGDGIRPEDQAHIFSTRNNGARLNAHGHGLGLSIVKKIVEKLGGSVQVESSAEPGAGSCFSFRLPGMHVRPVECEQPGVEPQLHAAHLS